MLIKIDLIELRKWALSESLKLQAIDKQITGEEVEFLADKFIQYALGDIEYPKGKPEVVVEMEYERQAAKDSPAPDPAGLFK